MSHSIWCRTCGEKIYNLNAKQLFGPDGKTLIKQIHILTGISLTEEPNMPNHICACCHLDLTHANNFRERCIQTDQFLRNDKAATSDPLTTESENSVESVPQQKPRLRQIAVSSSGPNKKQTEVQQLSGSNIKQHQVQQLGEPNKKRHQVHQLSEPKKTQQAQQLSNSLVENRSKQSPNGFRRTVDNNKKSYVCDQCGRCFSDVSNLKVHIVRHTGVKAFECKECGKKYYTGHLLNLHIRVRHQGEMPYSCKHCDQRFYTSTSRCRHEQVQHTRKKTYECRLCGKSYLTRSCLNKHEFLHTGERPYRCEVCKIGFPRNSNLKIHYRSKQHQKRASEVNDEVLDSSEEDFLDQDDMEFAESIIEELDVKDMS